MVVAPLGSYFLTVDTVFSGTSRTQIPENTINSCRKHYIRWGYGSGCCERCLDHIRPGSYGRGYQGAGGSEEITIGQKGRWAVYYLILIQPARENYGNIINMPRSWKICVETPKSISFYVVISGLYCFSLVPVSMIANPSTGTVPHR